MIYADVQGLTPGNLVTMYELDLSVVSGGIERYHNHNDGQITWQGETYYPWAIEGKNFARSGDGQQPRPELKVSNIGTDGSGNQITGVISALCIAYDDLVGAKVTRRRTFAKYLDAVNFTGGNPTADPLEYMPDEIWLVSRRKVETPRAVTFELTTPLQFDGVQIPARQVVAGFCGWLTMDGPAGGYRGAYCGYTGAEMFDKDGDPVLDPALDKCSGLVSTGCKPRFGEWQPLAFGGFPSADRTK